MKYLLILLTFILSSCKVFDIPSYYIEFKDGRIVETICRLDLDENCKCARKKNAYCGYVGQDYDGYLKRENGQYTSNWAIVYKVFSNGVKIKYPMCEDKLLQNCLREQIKGAE